MQRGFASTDFMADEENVGLLLHVGTEINTAWKQARDAFLATGWALNDVDDRMTAAEQESLRRAAGCCSRSRTRWHCNSTVARAVNDYWLPREVQHGGL